MANLDLITNPSKMNSNQAKNMLNDLARDVATGQVTTETDLLRRTFTAIRDLFSRLGKPTMKKRYIHPLSPPFSDTYNDTMREVRNDLHVLFDEAFLLGESVKGNFNHTVVERNKIRNRIKQLGDLVSDYVVTAKGTIHKNMVVQDNFTNKDKVDEPKTLGSKCRISVADGVVTLQVASSVDHSSTASLVTDSNGNLFGNGLPGNFGIAFETSAGKKGELSQVTTGEDKGANWNMMWATDPHDDPTVMFDSKPDSWFEYGVVNVPEAAKIAGTSSPYPDTRGFGWNFSDGTPIYYTPKEDPSSSSSRDLLKLMLHVRLPQAVPLNWISLNPFIPPGSGIYYTVTKIDVSEDDANYYTIPKSELIIGSDTEKTPFGYNDVVDKFTGKGVWAFPTRNVKFVKMYIETSQKYTLSTSTTGKAAHIYWLQSWTETTQKKYLFGLVKGAAQSTSMTERVQGPRIDKDKFIAGKQGRGDFKPTGAVVYDILASLAVAVGKMFVYEDISVSNLKVEPGLDIYESGSRFCVGIRDIQLYSFNYAQQSNLITKKFNLVKPIESISLSVTEQIPREFYEGDEAQRNNWIKYYISVDDGSTWNPISPLEHQQISPDIPMPPKIIRVNSTVPPDARNKSVSYIDTASDAKSIRLKVEMNRPAGSDATLTPVLTQYRIIMTPKEEA